MICVTHETRQHIFVIYSYLIYIYIYIYTYIYMQVNILGLLISLVWFYFSVFFSLIISLSEPIKYCVTIKYSIMGYYTI